MKEIPVDCIAHFDMNGKVTPLRIRLEDDQEEKQVIRIKNGVGRSERMVRTSPTTLPHKELDFRGKSILGDREVRFTVRFNCESCKWYLIK